jgi:hypothetical protein
MIIKSHGKEGGILVLGCLEDAAALPKALPKWTPDVIPMSSKCHDRRFTHKCGVGGNRCIGVHRLAKRGRHWRNKRLSDTGAHHDGGGPIIPSRVASGTEN